MQEDKIQQEIFIYFKNNFQRFGKGFIFSVPNGGSRNQIEAKKLKLTGATAGVSDLIVLLPNGKTLFFEVKNEKGKQSPSQIEFEKSVKNLGFDYYLIRSLDDFKSRVQEI